MKRRSQEEWHVLFTQHTASGLSIAAFCREQEIPPKSFCRRRKQLFNKPEISTSPSFVSVVTTTPHDNPMVELHPDSTLVIKIPLSVSPVWLGELVQQLRS